MFIPCFPYLFRQDAFISSGKMFDIIREMYRLYRFFAVPVFEQPFRETKVLKKLSRRMVDLQCDRTSVVNRDAAVFCR
jgi:hypothetical protein